VGLAVVFAIERRRGPLLASLGSLALAAGTIPLFDWTLGSYRFYAIHVQQTHPIEWAKILKLPATAHGLVAFGALAFLAWRWWISRHAPGHRCSDATRVAVLTSAAAAASLPAWLKYAGRDNNLTLLAIGFVCAGLLGAAKHLCADDRTVHPLLAPAAALLGLHALSPLAAPLLGPKREALAGDLAAVASVVRGDAAAGRRTLVLLSSAEWIAAGHRDVPPDRYQSAIELWYGGFPQANLLAAHIADGRYDTIVARGVYLRPEPSPLGRFNALLRDAIDRRYALAGSPGASFDDDMTPSLVFRKVR
jgi:hypothetical protein